MAIKKLGNILKLVIRAGNDFVDDEGFKLAASLSYYTLFALGPLLIIIISLAGIFLRPEKVQGELYDQLHDFVGSEAALGIQDIITNIQSTQATTAGAIIGSIALLIGATGVFTEMQGSINFIWSVRAKPKKGWLKYLVNRLISFSIIIGLGILMILTLILNALFDVLSEKLIRYFPNQTVNFFSLINLLVLLIIIIGLFMVIFKVLPDAIISWKDAFIGAGLTAVLFLFGRFLIGIYLGKVNLGLTYGTAASLVIILTWIFYSSIILYYGAEFTKVYAMHVGEGIRPKQTAVFIIKQESREIPPARLS